MQSRLHAESVHRDALLWQVPVPAPADDSISIAQSTCPRIWDPINARLEDCVVKYIFYVPAAYAILVLCFVLLRSISHTPLPLWLRNFVRERPSKFDEDSSLNTLHLSRSLRPSNALLVVSAIGLFSCIPTGIAQEWLMFGPQVASWAAAIIFLAIVRPKTTPPSLLALYSLLLTSCLVLLLNGKIPPALQLASWVTSGAMSLVGVAVILFMPLRHPRLPTDEISKTFTLPRGDLRSPEDNLTLWQWASISWMGPMIKEGKDRQLQSEDVWALAYDFQHSRLHEAFRQIKGSVTRRLLYANGLDLIIVSTIGLVEMLADFASPVLLQLLLRAMQDPQAPKRAPLVFTVLALVARLVLAQSSVFHLWYCRRAYERSRGEMIMMLYEKTLSRKIIGEKQPSDTSDEQSQQPASTGKVLNILRSDAYEVAQRFWEWPQLVTKPLGLIISVTLVWKLIGWPCLIGVMAVVFAAGVNLCWTKLLLRIERTRRAATDDKLKVVTEFVEAIRHLRYNSWELKWLNGILDARQRELLLRVRSDILVTLMSFTNDVASGMFPMLAFWAYTVLAGRALTVDIAFPALQLFTMLSINLQDIPNLITVMLHAWVAMGRIEAFMKEPDRIQIGSEDNMLIQEPLPLQLSGASFAWPGREQPVLRDVTLEISPGLTVIHGKVGAGKSAFLRGLLGELDLLSGTYYQPNAKIAYCGQTPWLQNMSIRDNILFGAPFDVQHYKNVIKACALTADLINFQNGDLSFVGENGIGLSGGQKARVALARAVYSHAPYMLLDDPISALDQQTAEHIMRECIASPLCKGRIVILVTHRLDLVEGLVKAVIEVREGKLLTIDIDTTEAYSRDATTEGAHSSDYVSGTANASNKKDDEVCEQLQEAVKDKFIEEEKRAHGGVRFGVYWEFIRAGKIRWWIILIFLLIATRLVGVTESWFLKAWGESYDRISAFISLKDPFKGLPPPNIDIQPWLFGFFFIVMGRAIIRFITNLIMVVITYCAGKQMFDDIMHRVSNAAFRFYDVTPVGRLMNRMTSDIGVVDGNISQQLLFMLTRAVGWMASVVVIASVTPIFLGFIILITAAFVLIFMQFIPTSQSLRRLEMVSLSPLMANFGTLIEGLVTVRAFRAQRRFQDGVIQVVDTFQKMDHFYWSLEGWLTVRFDALSAFSTFALTVIAIYTNVSPGLTAFVLVAASNFVLETHALCQKYGQLQLEFTSVERVVELLHIDQEPVGEKSPPAAWPTSGEIVFDHVNIRYAEHLDLVLRDINLTIPGGSNVALIGRTGSGKSTLALALLATVRPSSGTIYLDGIDICTIKSSELRKRITFLAQEPTLFAGNMRQNLDPLDEFSDAECASVLERLGARYGWTLDTHVDSGGKNLSQGQRQLVQLARAILRRSPLVILDEATASIDLGTSMEVQDILRQEMRGSTVLTIAHRVEAVSNADWCIELAGGRVVAQGSARTNGSFGRG